MGKIKPFAYVEEWSSGRCGIRIPHAVIFSSTESKSGTESIVRAINLGFLERIKKFKQKPAAAGRKGG